MVDSTTIIVEAIMLALSAVLCGTFQKRTTRDAARLTVVLSIAHDELVHIRVDCDPMW